MNMRATAIALPSRIAGFRLGDFPIFPALILGGILFVAIFASTRLDSTMGSMLRGKRSREKRAVHN